MKFQRIALVGFSLAICAVAQTKPPKEIPFDGDDAPPAHREGPPPPPVLLKDGAPAFPAKGHPDDPINSVKAVETPGTGPHQAHIYTVPGLPDHTLYGPMDHVTQKTPILLWGNGGCASAGTIDAPFLLEIASHGFTIIANGDEIPQPELKYSNAYSFGQSSGHQLVHGLEWAIVAAKIDDGTYTYLDTTRVAAAGHSCGGKEAAIAAQDPRIKAVGIFNAGGPFPVGAKIPENYIAPPGRGGHGGHGERDVLTGTPDGSTFKVPAFYFIGGPSDFSYENAKHDYNLTKVPSWIGNYAPSGHPGTFNEVHGGKYGEIAAKWLKWVLLQDKESADWFKNDKATAAGWSEVQKKDLDKIPAHKA
ncbi:hypothetical protein BT63DRAFT_484043 [Microthyrium microscopicum]|uniref:Alpha/beta-hydrolase n=1 Tax=Microthyrium microscopicum TaxID=703497 RepID=A0A6A6TX28_9PEZI|nr:hypothetical protein BT63DRAFT_484043 [Microthyrium microscopicum]